MARDTRLDQACHGQIERNDTHLQQFERHRLPAQRHQERLWGRKASADSCERFVERLESTVAKREGVQSTWLASETVRRAPKR